MTIQTLKHQYYVLQKVRETKEFEQFLCREENETGEKLLFDIFQIKERELVVKLIMALMEQTKNRAFEDFYECFSRDGELFLVFAHRASVSLAEKLENEACVLKERIAIGRKILERILLLNMPDMLVYDVLRSDYIQVTPALDVHFLYSLEEIHTFELVTRQKVFAGLANVLALLFQRELLLEISSEIPELLQNLTDGKYNDYLDVYQAYLRMADKLEEGGAGLKPNTFWFRVWEKIKGAFGKIKAALVILLVLVLVGYLLYSIVNPVSVWSEKYDFQQIGTLTIPSQEELDEEAADADEESQSEEKIQ